jgi:hypothetical protein
MARLRSVSAASGECCCSLWLRPAELCGHTACDTGTRCQLGHASTMPMNTWQPIGINSGTVAALRDLSHQYVAVWPCSLSFLISPACPDSPAQATNIWCRPVLFATCVADWLACAAVCAFRCSFPRPFPYALPPSGQQLFVAPNGGRCAGQFRDFYQVRGLPCLLKLKLLHHFTSAGSMTQQHFMPCSLEANVLSICLGCAVSCPGQCKALAQRHF